jgi:hypothetical protein
MAVNPMKIEGPSTSLQSKMDPTMLPSYRHILDIYFQQSNGRQIIAHQIESFNNFMDSYIPEVVTMVNPLIIRGSPEVALSGPRSALASATGLSTSAANALMGHSAEELKHLKILFIFLSNMNMRCSWNLKTQVCGNRLSLKTMVLFSL